MESCRRISDAGLRAHACSTNVNGEIERVSRIFLASVRLQHKIYQLYEFGDAWSNIVKLSAPSPQGLTCGVNEVEETTSIGKWSPLDRPQRGTQIDLRIEKSVV